MSNNLVYGVPSAAYGPRVLDEAAYTPQVLPGSPQPSPGFPGASLSLTQGNNTAIVNAFPTGFANKVYKVILVDLTNSRIGNPLPINALPGTLIWAVWADDVTTVIGGDNTMPGPADTSPYATVRINSQTADRIPIGPAFEISGMPFQSLFLENSAQPNKRLWILLSNDQPIDRVDSAN